MGRAYSMDLRERVVAAVSGDGLSYREVEHGAVSNAALLVKPEPDRPHLLWFQRALCAELSASVPRW